MSNEMPSQIVFLLDLDGCVPLGEDGEGLLRRACSALLWAEASMSPGLKDKTDLPSFVLRFYSSSGYFGIHDQSSYEFQDLAPESFEDLERVLSERLLALQSSFDASNFEFHGSQNRSDPVASLRTSLDLLARHYHWDRPLLHSPIKKNRHSFENSVYVFTSIPNTKREYRKTFHKSAKSHTQKELSDALFTKNVLQRFRQEISLYIVDFSLSNPSSFLEPPIKELFHKTLKPIRNGGLIPFTSLISYSHLSPYISSYKALRSKHPDKCISQNISLQGTLIPAFPLKNANRIKVECASILGMYPMDAFSGCQEWESHHSFRLAGSYEFFKAMSHWVLLIVLDTSKLAVLFNYGILSILSAKESSTYLSIFRVPEKPLTPCPNILKKIIDKHLKSNTLAKTIGSEKNLVKNNFSDGDLETWRIPNECADMSKRIKESKKSKGKWIEILVNSCKPKVSRMYQSEKRNNLLMERNDSGFSEGKRSSSSSSLSRRLSDESIGRRTRRGNQPIVSRGAELLRLGNQKYAENKKRRSQIKSSKNSTESFSFPFNDLRTARRTAFEKEMRKSFENEEVIQCSQILAMLIEFQIEAINNGDDVSMSALAEITISSLLKHLQSTGQIKANLVNLVADNFLVDPLSISRRKTSLKMPKRLRDHKLQVLYRMELHWLLPSADDQEKFENEILIHLRQISIWGSPEDMVTFLNEVLTPVYIDRQPELLCSLYDELNQPKADALRGIFSPSAKSDCSSVAPSSVMSQASNASQNSSKNPSLRSHNNKSVARIKKLRRPHSFDMGQRRQISQPHLKTTARVLAKNPTCNIKDKVGPSVTASPSSKGRSGLHRVKRNLSFDGLGRSPMKKPSTPRKKHETPKKKVTGTPKRMTPNKTHRIYAPETPKNKTRRKSDGLITIEESPDIDSIKACKTTPRRMRASLNLYKKTSFYSGDVSRNLMKAEENVNAFKIQGTSSQSQPFLDESSCDNTAGYLFQHIIRKRNRPDDEDDNSRKKIRKIDDDHRFLSDPSSSPMKTPKKMTFKTPVKESPSPSKRVQFNMQHQPPTPSRGTPAKSILKTPSKEPQTPTNRLNSPLVHSSAARKSSPHLSNHLMRKKRIIFEDSPSKPRLLVPIRQCSSTSTKKKIDFEETKSDYSGQPLEIEIPDSDLDKIVLKSKVSMFEPESSSCKDFAGDEKEISYLKKRKNPCKTKLSSSNNPFLNEDSLENESTEYPSSTNNVISNDTTPLKNACTSSKICDTDVDSRIIDTNIKNNIESAVIDNSDTNVLRPIQLENIHEDLSVLETEPIDDNGPIKRTNRSRRATQRLGIDDVPIIGTPSPLRKATKLTSKGSSIRRNLFDSNSQNSDTDENIHSGTTEIRRKTSRARSFTQRFGIDDITLDEAVSPVRTKKNKKRKSKKTLKKVNVDDPVDSIVDDLGDKNELEIEPSSISPVKHWSITNIIESPQGEIKLKINRTPKSTFISQRISRSLVSEIGVSPERLRRLLTHTPSPKKNHSIKEDPLNQKYSPLSSMSLIQLTTSPILDKNKSNHKSKKVNKRLYID